MPSLTGDALSGSGLSGSGLSGSGLSGGMLTDVVLAALAAWRLTFLLTQEDGPWDVIARVRHLAGDSMPGRALQCFYCTSLWVAAPLAVMIVGWQLRAVLVWLALSGAACLLHRATDRGLEVMPLPPRETGDEPPVSP
jgi:hypothetical protein